jgi:DNA-binding transcriptional MocR family regulator
MQYKYQSIISEITTGIHRGNYPLDKKLPSLRKMAKITGCALSVVVQAYRELEIQGVIQATPKSGYIPLAPKLKGKEDRRPDLPSPAIKSRKAEPHTIIGKVIELGLRKDILPFACGMPDESLLPIKQLKKCIQKTAQNWPELLSEYAPSQGSLNLRKQIASLMKLRGVGCEPNEIIITNGCMEALVLVLRCLLKPGDIVAIESPTFFGILPILKEFNIKIIELPTSTAYGINLQALESAAKQETIKACLVSGTLQNPLGFSMSSLDKIQLLAICKKFQIKLIEDDVYSEAQFEHNQSLPIRHYGQGEGVIYCSSFSKSISPGLRLGWVLPGTLLEKIQKLKMSETLGGPMLLQESMALFLEAGGYAYHLRRFRKIIANNCFQYRRTILKYFPEGTCVTNPKGGFFLWVELPTKESLQPLLALAIENKLSFVPGEVFSSSGRCKNCLRIYSGSIFNKRIEIGLQKLGKLISTYLGV